MDPDTLLPSFIGGELSRVVSVAFFSLFGWFLALSQFNLSRRTTLVYEVRTSLKIVFETYEASTVAVDLGR